MDTDTLETVIENSLIKVHDTDVLGSQGPTELLIYSSSPDFEQPEAEVIAALSAMNEQDAGIDHLATYGSTSEEEAILAALTSDHRQFEDASQEELDETGLLFYGS